MTGIDFDSILGTSDSLAAAVSAESFLACSAVSVVLGIACSATYMFKNDYSKSFVVALALLPLTVQAVITLVNGNQHHLRWGKCPSKGRGGSCGRLDRHHFRRGVLRGVWNDGEAQIASCNEGLEAEQVYVNGGDIRVKADDDGLNASAREVTATGEQAAANQTEGGWGLEGAMRKGM